MAAFGAARMEQEIVKIPKHEIIVALVAAQPLAVSGCDLEENLALKEQSEERIAREVRLPAQRFDLLRRSECGDGCDNPPVADTEQGAGPGDVFLRRRQCAAGKTVRAGAARAGALFC